MSLINKPEEVEVSNPRDFLLTTKIRTNDGKFIQIQDVKLKYIINAMSNAFKPPNEAQLLMSSNIVQHFSKGNLLSGIFALKKHPSTIQHFVKVINQLIKAVSSVSHSKTVAKAPPEHMVIVLSNSELVKISDTGMISIQFHAFTADMFGHFVHLLDLQGTLQQHYITAAQALHDEDPVFQSSIQMQLLIMIIEQDINALAEVISSTSMEEQQDASLKEYTNNEEDNDDIDNEEEFKLHEGLDRRLSQAEDNELKTATTDDIMIGMTEKNGIFMPDLNMLDLNGYKRIMNIQKPWKPISDADFIVNENVKLAGDEDHRMNAVFKISAAIKSNKIKFVTQVQDNIREGLDHELQERSVNTLLLLNVGLYQIQYPDKGLLADIRGVCKKLNVVLTNGEMNNLCHGRITRVLDIDNDDEGKPRSGCIKLAINPVSRTMIYAVIQCKPRKSDTIKINNKTIRERAVDTISPIYGVTFDNNYEDDDYIVAAAVRGFTSHDINPLTCKLEHHLGELLIDYPIPLRVVVAPLWVPFIDTQMNTIHTTCLTAIVLLKRSEDVSIIRKVQELLIPKVVKTRTSTITIAHATLEIRSTIKQFYNVPLCDSAKKRNKCLCVSGLQYITVEELLLGVEKVVKPNQVKSIFYEQDYLGAPTTYYLELDPTYIQALTKVVELNEYVVPGEVLLVEFGSLAPTINTKFPFTNLFQITESLLYKPNLVTKNISSLKK